MNQGATCIADSPPGCRAQSLRAAHAQRLRPAIRGMASSVNSVAIAARLSVALEFVYDLDRVFLGNPLIECHIHHFPT